MLKKLYSSVQCVNKQLSVLYVLKINHEPAVKLQNKRISLLRAVLAWNILLKFAKNSKRCRYSVTLGVNSGMRSGPTRGISARR